MLKVTQSRLSRRLLNEIGPTYDYIHVDKLNTVELFLRKVSELKGIFSTPDSARFPAIFFSHMLISNRPGWSEDSVCRSLVSRTIQVNPLKTAHCFWCHNRNF